MKNILIISSVLGITLLCLTLVYYVFFYLPNTQKNTEKIRYESRYLDRLKEANEICLKDKEKYLSELHAGLEISNELIASGLLTPERELIRNNIIKTIEMINSPNAITICRNKKLNEWGY